MAERPVLDADALEIGRVVRIEVDGTGMCVAHTTDGEFYAFSDICSHEDEPLVEGVLDGAEIECPTHSSIFDLRTGAVLGPPARVPIRTYPVSIADGVLYVDPAGA
jgi:3-phenylpropionate/trans-cinnamate dioxygenase ferredoxin subunit